MFRYIALAWNPASAADTSAGAQLALHLRAPGIWQPALLRPGLHVYVTGTGVNEAYPLRADQGVVLGKLFRRRELHHVARTQVALTEDDAQAALESGGTSLVRDLWGRYVAFLSPASGAPRVLRDPSGTLPCFVMRSRGVHIVFSWFEDAMALLPDATTFTVNWSAISAQLAQGHLGGRETALEGITQVLPGEVVEIGEQEPSARLLWSASACARVPASDSPAVAAEQLRDTVRACATTWANSYDSILFRLSGGVDSSILLSCLNHASTRAEITCLNYHSPGSDSDERRYARLAASRAGRDLVERERDSTFRLESVLGAAPMPIPESYVGRMNARVDAQLAAWHGATAMFTGAGGDQLFFEFHQWWPAADYLLQRGLDAGFASAAMDAARLGRLSVWKTIALVAGNRLRGGHADSGNDALRRALVTPHALTLAQQRSGFLHPGFADTRGIPIGKMNQVRALMYPVAYYDPFERDAAAELVNPLLSQPLVELSLKLPTYLLAHGGQGRALARRAFASELPSEIASRRSKGGMAELTRSVLLHNIAFARGMLLEGELVQRGLLDRKGLELALSGRSTTPPTPVGLLHTYIGMEAWLRHWSSPRLRRAA